MSSRDSNDMMVGDVTTLDGKLFHISTVLCVNEYFLMSSLKCDLYSLYCRRPLVVDSSLVRRKLDTSSSYLPVRIF